MPVKTAFAELLTARRHELGLTQAKAAERCELSERGYQKIENAEVVPGLDTAAGIARALELSLDLVLRRAWGSQPPQA